MRPRPMNPHVAQCLSHDLYIILDAIATEPVPVFLSMHSLDGESGIEANGLILAVLVLKLFKNRREGQKKAK